MAKDTITLALNGEVTMAHFASAMSDLRALVQALSEELGVAEQVEWLVYDLQVGSANTTLRGEADVLKQVERVVEAYTEVGEALQSRQRPPFSDRVVRAAYGITDILDDRVTSVRFETADKDVTIVERLGVTVAPATVRSYGAIEGIVQTLTNRKGLRFNLYDTLHDRAVSCYVQEGKEDLMREIWGKRASVEGEVSRESVSGRPVAVRGIMAIRMLPEMKKGSYLEARGVVPLKAGASMPEEIIRQLRDA